jgi:hypothetical protein
MTTAADLEAILLPYNEIGYLQLPLLNKTDIQHLKAAFGEPARHAAPRDRHVKIWERYRSELRRAKQQMYSPSPTSNQTKLRSN